MLSVVVLVVVMAVVWSRGGMVQRVREMVCKRGGGDKETIIPAQMVDVWVGKKDGK